MPVTFTLLPRPRRIRGEGSLNPFFFNPETSRTLLEAAENAGFGAIVVDDGAGLLANLDLAVGAASSTEAMTVAVTHWPGVMAPDAAAQQLSAINKLSADRLAIRVPAPDMSGIPDGDRLGRHVVQMRRADEYLTLLKRLWLSDAPFDHEGPHYSIRNAYVAAKGGFGRNIGIRMSGSSGAALAVAGRHATVFELEAASLFDIRTMIRRTAAAATPYGRAGRITFALPIAVLGQAGLDAEDGHPACTINLDDPARAALSLIPFIELGIGEFMISGLGDAAAIDRFGRGVLPLVRNSAVRVNGHVAGAPGASDLWSPWGERSATIRWRDHRRR